ncbi:MAG: NlpC/P60 family protein [bacterium]
MKLENRICSQAFALLACFVSAIALFLAGCSSSKTTREIEGKPTGIVQDENEFRYLTKIKKERAREDDKKVDLRSFKKRVAADPSAESNILPNGLNRDQFLLEVVRYLGVQYSYGGSTKQGMDCSGFTCEVYRTAASTPLPRSTAEQFRTGEKIARRELQFGDLVFFNTTGHSPSHVGIYIEDDIFAHASVNEGVTLSSLESTYYKKRFVGARRVVE